MKVKVKKEKRSIRITLDLTPEEIALATYQGLDTDDKLTTKSIPKLSQSDIKGYLAYACEGNLPTIGEFRDSQLGKLLVEQVRKKFPK